MHWYLFETAYNGECGGGGGGGTTVLVLCIEIAFKLEMMLAEMAVSWYYILVLV